MANLLARNCFRCSWIFIRFISSIPWRCTSCAPCQPNAFLAFRSCEINYLPLKGDSALCLISIFNKNSLLFKEYVQVTPIVYFAFSTFTFIIWLCNCDWNAIKSPAIRSQCSNNVPPNFESKSISKKCNYVKYSRRLQRLMIRCAS